MHFLLFPDKHDIVVLLYNVNVKPCMYLSESNVIFYYTILVLYIYISQVYIKVVILFIYLFIFQASGNYGVLSLSKLSLSQLIHIQMVLHFKNLCFRAKGSLFCDFSAHLINHNLFNGELILEISSWLRFENMNVKRQSHCFYAKVI